ncbi:MAG: acetylglutamate kinase [Chloroflexi bacterium]|nr:acetylglutamate kinase [Chloroflexota bacterium]
MKTISLPDQSPGDDAQVRTLVEALPYMTRWSGATIVVKLGGSALEAERAVLEDCVYLRHLGANPIIVHGGGASISSLLKRLGIESQWVNGLRVTDKSTRDVARMVLIGEVNASLVALVNELGGRALGLSGLDGPMIRAHYHREYGDIGFVGEIDSIDTTPIQAVVSAGFIPIIAPIGYGPNGEALNINADTAAADIAVALQAQKMIFLTDVIGILDASHQLISEVSVHELDALMESGAVSGGMIPKVKACKRAMAGVQQTHIIDGRFPHALIRELFTDSGVGTMIMK